MAARLGARRQARSPPPVCQSQGLGEGPQRAGPQERGVGSTSHDGGAGVMEFLSSSVFLLGLFGFLKAFFVAMFGLNLGVILTWVERRMRGMIQDSIGPNRAAIPVPGPV